MTKLFGRVIDGWQAWSEVYCDAEAFLPLVQAIYRQAGMAVPTRLGQLTPGTNAVFRHAGTVVKVFAPVESGFDSSHDYLVETAMLAYAQQQGIRTSRLLAQGQVEDAYLFRYVILEYVEGAEAGRYVSESSVEEKDRFAGDVRRLCEALHRPCAGLLPPIDLKERARTNKRLDALPGPLREDMRRRVKRLTWTEDVIVHGDMTGENLLVTQDGEPVLIDFADSVSGPAWYELAPLAFELFRADKALVNAYRGQDDLRVFVGQVLDALALHDFGANILLDFAQREDIALQDFRTLDALGTLLMDRWA